MNCRISFIYLINETNIFTTKVNTKQIKCILNLMRNENLNAKWTTKIMSMTTVVMSSENFICRRLAKALIRMNKCYLIFNNFIHACVLSLSRIKNNEIHVRHSNIQTNLNCLITKKKYDTFFQLDWISISIVCQWI